MLQYIDGGAYFSCSATEYHDTWPGMAPGNRIYVPVQFDTLPKTVAIVDTGAPWCVLSKEAAKSIDPDYSDQALETIRLNIRNEELDGALVRLPITICADEGEDITIEGTVFVPDDEFDVPNFIGLDGFLNRIRFAVDPQRKHFFFGPILE